MRATLVIGDKIRHLPIPLPGRKGDQDSLTIAIDPTIPLGKYAQQRPLHLQNHAGSQLTFYVPEFMKYRFEDPEQWQCGTPGSRGSCFKYPVLGDMHHQPADGEEPYLCNILVQLSEPGPTAEYRLSSPPHCHAPNSNGKGPTEVFYPLSHPVLSPQLGECELGLMTETGMIWLPLTEPRQANPGCYHRVRARGGWVVNILVMKYSPWSAMEIEHIPQR